MRIGISLEGDNTPLKRGPALKRSRRQVPASERAL